jgi:hypothetical protein
LTIFLRLLEAEADEKGATLAEAAARWRSGSHSKGTFQVEPSSFELLPGSPFAYWLTPAFWTAFSRLATFQSGNRSAASGASTNDNDRFVRAAWEVAAKRVAGARNRAGKWQPLAKGGEYARYYSDVHLLLAWDQDGAEIKEFVAARRDSKGWGRHWKAELHNSSEYFRRGLTWSRRTTRGLSFRALPVGCIFGEKGPAVLLANDPSEPLLALLAMVNSVPFGQMVGVQVAAATAAARSYEVGIVQRTPTPEIGELQERALAENAARAWSRRRTVDTAAATSHAFLLPALLHVAGPTLASRADAWSDHLRETQEDLARIQAEIDDIAFTLYGIDGEDRRQMEEGFGSLVLSEEGADVDEEEDEAEGEELGGAHPVALTEALLEWTLGVALGRFDVRLATGERPPPPEPDPFDPLPVCSPGELQDEAGLPTTEAPSGYPLGLPPHGILVDDPGHLWDVVARMEAVLDLVAREHAHGWIQGAEAILGRGLREWLRRYGFERHLKRYSRSRRKAPLFWHLAPKSRAYGIWLYSPVATRDTTYRLLNDYVDPRLKSAERQLLELRQESGAASTGQQRRELTGQESLVEELRAFREQVARVAPLWAPHRDDGVVLNCAVFWRLFDHHRGWQKDCKAKWGELAQGKYDWSGWAMHLWPERVVKRCASDRSIAIAHGLEDALWVEDEDGKWTARPDAKGQVAKQTADRRSPAIQAALDTFVRAG